MTKVTRVEVIDRSKGVEDGGGRVYQNWEVDDCWVSYQDNGRTLKIFINESDPEPEVELELDVLKDIMRQTYEYFKTTGETDFEAWLEK